MKIDFKNLLSIIIIIVFLFSCGHRKRPTGGPKDTIKPEIVSIYPEEYSNISGRDIEVVFSKPIERNTIISGLYVYPPILKKKFKWDKSILTIIILEELEDSTNYFFSFTQTIKGEHKNELDKEYTFIYSGGKLNTNRISGNIVFEKIEDAAKPVNFKLMAADSTFILNKEFSSKTYEIGFLNNIEHIIESYVDNNNNHKYDYGKEPYSYLQVPAGKFLSIDLEMNYADSLKPGLSSAKAIWNNLIELSFSEEVDGFENVHISTIDSLPKPMGIVAQSLHENSLFLLTETLDTLQYKIILTGLFDLKSNLSDTLQIIVEGSTIRDSIPPKILSVSPRNGSTINNLQPKIIIKFSEIILEHNFEARLNALESGEEVKLLLLEKNSDTYILKPIGKLKNYSSYTLLINVTDLNENIFREETLAIFIPIVR